jgi:hypothetical protein
VCKRLRKPKAESEIEVPTRMICVSDEIAKSILLADSHV